MTRNGFNGAGAPIGKRPATTDLGLKKMAEIIRESHKGNPSERETAKCLVVLKT
jgi:hypothetical protein